MAYNFREIEAKWQKKWAENKTFAAQQPQDFKAKAKPPYYVLDMFPYPSGAGLHVGHPLGYIASDIYARYKRHKGFNVLHPQGYDSFGLPAEQYAIQTGQHPAITTEVNIKRYREQLDRIGFLLIGSAKSARALLTITNGHSGFLVSYSIRIIAVMRSKPNLSPISKLFFQKKATPTFLWLVMLLLKNFQHRIGTHFQQKEKKKFY